MTINRGKANAKTVELKEISSGQCFKGKDGKYIYLKTRKSIKGGTVVCVNLETGETFDVSRDFRVIPVKAELNVIEEG